VSQAHTVGRWMAAAAEAGPGTGINRSNWLKQNWHDGNYSFIHKEISNTAKT